MNVYFSVYRVKSVSYTNCVFPNGVCAAGCATTFMGCNFANNASGKYSLWVYDDAQVTVVDSEFTGVRGVKMYEEIEETVTNTLSLVNTTFSESVAQKPAIVLTYGNEVELEGNTYPSKGVFELDKDGAPNGTKVTADIKNIICTNDDYPDGCGVWVDGKIYTTVADAAEVAAEGSVVKLMCSPTGTVEFTSGVMFDRNGHNADYVTVEPNKIQLRINP